MSGSVFSLHLNEISLHQEPKVCASISKPDEFGLWTQEEVETECRRRLLHNYKSIVTPDITMP